MDYLRALEEERKKILVFERELPLSLELITQAIETIKKQHNNEVEISSEGPVLEEFIPLRPSCSSSDDENNHRDSVVSNSKPDWLRSVQLWNQQPEPKGDVVMKPIAVNANRVGGAFHPFEKEKGAKGPTATAPASSTTENTNGGGGGGGGGSGDGSGGSREEKDKEGNSQRKTRRCWSPELHRRFLNALEQLGGSHGGFGY